MIKDEIVILNKTVMNKLFCATVLVGGVMSYCDAAASQYEVKNETGMTFRLECNRRGHGGDNFIHTIYHGDTYSFSGGEAGTTHSPSCSVLQDNRVFLHQQPRCGSFPASDDAEKAVGSGHMFAYCCGSRGKTKVTVVLDPREGDAIECYINGNYS